MAERVIRAYKAGNATIIGATEMARGILSPEVMGVADPIEGQKKGGFFSDSGFTARLQATQSSPRHTEIPQDSDAYFRIEITPPMGPAAIKKLGDFLKAKDLIHPGEFGANLYDSTSGEDILVTHLADPQPHKSIDDILTYMELAGARVEEQTRRLHGVQPSETQTNPIFVPLSVVASTIQDRIAA
jgi:hypothetical protein